MAVWRMGVYFPNCRFEKLQWLLLANDLILLAEVPSMAAGQDALDCYENGLLSSTLWDGYFKNIYYSEY